MNYRHGFHAGNFADVVKHAIFARLIEYLKRKPAPFRIIDLHAGPGFYDLRSEDAERTGEWRAGVGRLYREGSCEPDPLSPEAEALLAPWRKAVAAANDGVRLARYPGSPEIARRLVREVDALAFNELHPEDLEALETRFSRERRARITALDAWAAAKAALPPIERRGIVFADPSYESTAEADRALAGLAEAHRRFGTGALCLWYPIKAQANADALARRVAGLALPRTVRIELTVRRAAITTERLNGSGLVVVNPPWTLRDELHVLLPELSRRLAADPASPGSWRVETLVGESGPADR